LRARVQTFQRLRFENAALVDVPYCGVVRDHLPRLRTRVRTRSGLRFENAALVDDVLGAHGKRGLVLHHQNHANEKLRKQLSYPAPKLSIFVPNPKVTSLLSEVDDVKLQTPELPRISNFQQSYPPSIRCR
jgi:plasmid stabilization system protein ParE